MARKPSETIKKARYDNAGDHNEGIQIYGSVAITMGNVWVTDKSGKEVMVDKTWVFKKGKDGKLRIIEIGIILFTYLKNK